MTTLSPRRLWHVYSFGKWHLGSSHGNSKGARQIGNTILDSWMLAFFFKKIDNFCSTFFQDPTGIFSLDKTIGLGTYGRIYLVSGGRLHIHSSFSNNNSNYKSKAYTANQIMPKHNISLWEMNQVKLAQWHLWELLQRKWVGNL